MKHLLPEQSLTSKEVAFLAEQELIMILPRYTMNGTQLVGQNMPKLKSLQRAQVPIWLAILLKKQNKCNIVTPDWLTVPFLKSKYAEEQRRKDRVTQLPWHWIPISKILLDICPDDFVDSPHELRSLIQDLREIRMLKTRQGFAMIDDEYLELTGLSLLEINEIRPFLIQSMNTLRELKKVSLSDDEEEEEENREENEEQAQYGQDQYENSELRVPSDILNGEPNDFNNYGIGNSVLGHDNTAYNDANRTKERDTTMDTSTLNTSTMDATLVEPTVGQRRQKRRRVDPRSIANTSSSNIDNNNNNNNNNNSDSDSDVEYRHN